MNLNKILLSTLVLLTFNSQAGLISWFDGSWTTKACEAFSGLVTTAKDSSFGQAAGEYAGKVLQVAKDNPKAAMAVGAVGAVGVVGLGAKKVYQRSKSSETPEASAVDTNPVQQTPIFEVVNLKSGILGENKIEKDGQLTISGTAQAFSKAIETGDMDQAKQQLIFLEALLGDKNMVVVMTEGNVNYTVKGLQALRTYSSAMNNVSALEMALNQLGFGLDVANKDLNAKKVYLQAYLNRMHLIINEDSTKVELIQEIHNTFKDKFENLCPAGSNKTVADIENHANLLALTVVHDFLTKQAAEKVKSYYGIGNKTTIALESLTAAALLYVAFRKF